MRQEQQLQKLRARQEKKTLDQSKSKADLNCQGTSLLPALEEVTAICVEDVVPVSAKACVSAPSFELSSTDIHASLSASPSDCKENRIRCYM